MGLGMITNSGVDMDKHRVLVIGLDGATLELIEPWARAGHLPNFARLLEETLSRVCGAFG